MRVHVCQGDKQPVLAVSSCVAFEVFPLFSFCSILYDNDSVLHVELGYSSPVHCIVLYNMVCISHVRNGVCRGDISPHVFLVRVFSVVLEVWMLR